MFSLRHDLGSNLAIDALKRWLRVPESSPSQLLAMAENFPKAKPALQNTLEILL